MKLLSIVVPAYNEQDNIPTTTARVDELMKEQGINYELIYVDDGSKDGTWECLKNISLKYDTVNALRFSRNFGKEGAIFAGLKAAKGDACVIMDCDLQHPPELMVQMYRIWEKNDIDVVEARKSSRGKESIFYKAFAKSFYRLLHSTSGIDLSGASDFKLLDRKVVDCLNQMPERLTFFRALSSWVGFKTEVIYFEVQPRLIGTSKWSFRNLFKLAVNSITSFTNLPTQIVTICGMLFFIFSIVVGANTLINYISGNAQEGFSTVILLLLIIGSIIMLSLGIIGHYLSKIYEEIKFRPRYLIAEEINITDINTHNRKDDDVEVK